MLFEPLSQEMRGELLLLVTDVQKDFLLNIVKRGRRTIFSNLMVEEKVQAIQAVDNLEIAEDERSVDAWEIVDYVDFGHGNRIGKCTCGNALRYMFTVQHKKTNKRIPFGIYHLSDFLNIDVKEIKSIVSGIKKYDYELDELLLKIKDHDYGYEILDELPAEIKLSKDIQDHIDHHIPLLNDQIKKIERQFKNYIAEQMEKAQKERRAAEELKCAKSKAAYKKAQEIIRARHELEQKALQVRDEKILESIQPLLSKSNPTIAEIALKLVNSGVSSANEITRIIRNNFNFDKRNSIATLKRPYIYMDVVVALMNEAENGLVYFDQESSSIDDCYFYPSEDDGKIAEPMTNNYQPTLF